MTKEEILALEAGGEIDALIAQRVMGWETETIGGVTRRCWAPDDGRTGRWRDVIPEFSKDLNACWDVEAELLARGLHCWYAVALREIFGDRDPFGMFDLIHADALTRCKAALLAVEGAVNA